MSESTVRERTSAEPRGILALLRDLAGTGLDLAHNTVQLAACEARVVLRRLALRAGLFVGAVVFAAMGLLLILGGGALLLEQVAGIPTWLALAIVGSLALAAGIVVAKRMLERLGESDIAFPATLAEFRTDVETMRRSARAAVSGAGAPDERA